MQVMCFLSEQDSSILEACFCMFRQCSWRPPDFQTAAGGERGG